ncbi:DUF4292 domain-containing protein [Limibacter armeniacum]|uniref:DUF4292 domain-containing protein n=1 Tax=Limibacter armeniacum TaxID=466084 RepID=UPI002FE61340
MANRKRVKADNFAVDNLDYHYLSSKAKVNVHMKGQQQKVTADIRVVKDSALWISVRTMGIEGLRVLADRDSLRAISRLSKEYYQLSYADLYLLTETDIDYALLQAMLIGELPEDYNMKNKGLIDDEFFILRRFRGDYKIRAYISRTLLKLEKLFVEKKKGKDGVKVLYSDFKEITDKDPIQVFPFKTKIEIGEVDDLNISLKKMDADIDFIRVEIEKDPMRLPFKITDKYEVITAQDLRDKLKVK